MFRRLNRNEPVVANKLVSVHLGTADHLSTGAKRPSKSKRGLRSNGSLDRANVRHGSKPEKLNTSTCFPLFIQERTLTGSRALAMDSKMSVRITRPCRVLPFGEPQNPRTGGDPDTAACYPLPDYVLHGTPLILSTLQRSRGFPRLCGRRRAYGLQLRGL